MGEIGTTGTKSMYVHVFVIIVFPPSKKEKKLSEVKMKNHGIPTLYDAVLSKNFHQFRVFLCKMQTYQMSFIIEVVVGVHSIKNKKKTANSSNDIEDK
jgi:hypothetical protein